MRFLVNLCTYSNAKMLIDSVNSLDAGPHDMTIYLHLHSRRRDMLEAVGHLMSSRNDIRLFDWGFNRGVGQGTNDTLIDTFTQGYDMMIDSQDDLTWGEGDLVRLVEYAAAHPEYYCIETMGQNANLGRMGLQYRAAAFTRTAWEQIGLFDENFIRAYFEDTDYEERVLRLGLKMATCHETNVWHFGSGTLANNPELQADNHACFRANYQYFVMKWGGDPGHTQYAKPFNVEHFGLRIGPEERLNPYGWFDRTDRDQWNSSS